MQAMVSGQAGLALLVDGDAMWSVEIDEPTRRVPRRRADVPHLFDGVTDLARLDGVTEASVVETLERAWRNDRALRLILILLDRGAGDELRASVVESLDDSFLVAGACAFVRTRLHAAPLPVESDLPGAIRRAEDAKESRLAGLLRTLVTTD